MRCLNCHYSLANLTENRCPECGTAFDPNDPSTFSVPRRINWRQVRWLVVASYGLGFLGFAVFSSLEPPVVSWAIGALLTLPFWFAITVIAHALLTRLPADL